MSVAAGEDPFDAAESRSLVFGGAAVAYEYGAQVGSVFILGCALLGVGIPRAVSYMEKRAKKAKKTIELPIGAENQLKTVNHDTEKATARPESLE